MSAPLTAESLRALEAGGPLGLERPSFLTAPASETDDLALRSLLEAEASLARQGHVRALQQEYEQLRATPSLTFRRLRPLHRVTHQPGSCHSNPFQARAPDTGAHVGRSPLRDSNPAPFLQNS